MTGVVQTETTIATTQLVLITRRLFFALLMLLTFCLLLAGWVTFHGFSGEKSVLDGALTGSTVPFFVFAFGAIGGFVSLQRRLKSLTLSDLDLLVKSNIYIWLAPVVGGVLALLLFILFLSGLLESALFPKFAPDDSPAKGILSLAMQHASGGHSDYAKLLFWSFLAGFSENFVTDIIGRFEGGAVSAVPTQGTHGIGAPAPLPAPSPSPSPSPALTRPDVHGG